MMRLFERLLVHRCTLEITGEVIGRDEYGRDIIGTELIENVPCRADQIRERSSTDEYGTDYILDYMMFFSKDTKITMDAIIRDIVDLEGNPVLPGTFTPKSMMPFYRRTKLHHYEVTLQRTD